MVQPATTRKVTADFDSLQGFSRVSLSNGLITARFLPELGGKMVSLVRNESGHEFLLQPSEPARAYRRSSWGTDFASSDTSGFDECVPTVSACRYPHGAFSGQALPDHGELWSSVWEHRRAADGLAFSARGVRLPYQMTKHVHLRENEVVIGYSIRNLSDLPLNYLWSAHPLLTIEPGACIVLPPSVQEVFVNWSRHSRVGKLGNRVPWPGPQNLDTILGADCGTAEKLFATEISSGWCSLYKPISDESITFRFDPQRVPHVGIWICQGGWPETGNGHFTVALEPCSGYPDSLAEACRRGTCPELPPGGKHDWDLRLELHKGPPQTDLDLETAS